MGFGNVVYARMLLEPLASDEFFDGISYKISDNHCDGRMSVSDTLLIACFQSRTCHRALVMRIVW